MRWVWPALPRTARRTPSTDRAAGLLAAAAERRPPAGIAWERETRPDPASSVAKRPSLRCRLTLLHTEFLTVLTNAVSKVTVLHTEFLTVLLDVA